MGVSLEGRSREGDWEKFGMEEKMIIENSL
jgi:hypothetical protein